MSGQNFLERVKIEGGSDVVASFEKFTGMLQRYAVETMADGVLQKIASAMRMEVGMLPTKTDIEYTGKGGSGRKWPYLRRGRPVSPGMARQKVSTAIKIMPLGSIQRRLFIGKRVGVAGKSGAFYGRLMERGFTIQRKGRMKGWVRDRAEIPGRWMFFRLFKRMQQGAESEAVREFSEFIRQWNPPSTSSGKDLS